MRWITWPDDGVADARLAAGVAEQDGVGDVAGERADAGHDLGGEARGDRDGLAGQRLDVRPSLAQAAQRRLAVGAAGLVGGVDGLLVVVGDLDDERFELGAAGQLVRFGRHRHAVVCLSTVRRARWMRPLMAGTLVLSTSATWS